MRLQTSLLGKFLMFVQPCTEWGDCEVELLLDSGGEPRPSYNSTPLNNDTFTTCSSSPQRG